METKELVQYAEQRYGLKRVHRLEALSDLSVLMNPSTKQWIAVILEGGKDSNGRVRDTLCDIHCGRQMMEKTSGFYGFHPPCIMQGTNWIGVTMNSSLKREDVCQTLDVAVQLAEKRSQKSAHREKVYTATSIPTSVRFEKKEASTTPHEILEMMQMYEPGRWSEEDKKKNFYRQGKFMENYTDNHPWNGEIYRYAPVYHDLNIEQLRGYFTWRTQFRKGINAKTNMTFLSIYLDEIINQIGVKKPEDGIAVMERILKCADQLNPFSRFGNNQQISMFIADYAIYYHLSDDIIHQTQNEWIQKDDKWLDVLLHAEDHRDEEVFHALNELTSGNGTLRYLDRSALVKKNPAEAKSLFSYVWRWLLPREIADGVTTYPFFFGKKIETQWKPFDGAVFYEEGNPRPDGEVIVDNIWKYVCRNQKWTMVKNGRRSYQNPLFVDFLREIDCQARKKLKFGSPIKSRLNAPRLQREIDKAITAWMKQKEEDARPKITIDLSKLDGIRSDADVTRDWLMSDAERGEEDTKPAAPALTPEKKQSESPSLLNAQEMEIVARLLKGEEIKSYLRANHLMASVVCDAINEKLFDSIGDTALESDGDDLSIVEDYRDDLEKIVKGAGR